MSSFQSRMDRFLLSQLERVASSRPSSHRLRVLNSLWKNVRRSMGLSRCVTYITAMLLGSGFPGGRQFGGYDEAFFGNGMHGRDGGLVADNLGMSSLDFGSTQLALADIDPSTYLPQAEALTAILGSG